jgi:predicted DNA-binding protein
MDNHYIQTGRRGYHEAYKPGFKPRNKTLSFMAAEDEATRIDAAAKFAGLTRSAWVTKAVMHRLEEVEFIMKEAAKGEKKAAKKVGKSKGPGNP